MKNEILEGTQALLSLSIGMQKAGMRGRAIKV